jgi:hypothetical protein
MATNFWAPKFSSAPGLVREMKILGHLSRFIKSMERRLVTKKIITEWTGSCETNPLVYLIHH